MKKLFKAYICITYFNKTYKKHNFLVWFYPIQAIKGVPLQRRSNSACVLCVCRMSFVEGWGACEGSRWCRIRRRAGGSGGPTPSAASSPWSPGTGAASGSATAGMPSSTCSDRFCPLTGRPKNTIIITEINSYSSLQNCVPKDNNSGQWKHSC